MLLWNKDEKSPNLFSSFNSSWFWICALLSVYLNMWKGGRSSRECFATSWFGFFFNDRRFLPSDVVLLAHITTVQERAARQRPLREVAGVAPLWPTASARKISCCRNVFISPQPLLVLASLQPFTLIAWSLSWKERVFLLENYTLVLLWERRK